jgi:hypothetical protein
MAIFPKVRFAWLAEECPGALDEAERAGRYKPLQASKETALIPITSATKAPRSQSSQGAHFASMMPPDRTPLANRFPGKRLSDH